MEFAGWGGKLQGGKLKENFSEVQKKLGGFFAIFYEDVRVIFSDILVYLELRYLVNVRGIRFLLFPDVCFT